MAALDERTIAREVGILHDETRLRFPLERNTVETFDEFSELVGGYFNYHFSHCFTDGGALPPSVAWGRAKEMLQRQYRRSNGDIVTCYNDAHDSTNGGMRAILDILADGLKEEAITYYVEAVFDRLVKANQWGDKVAIIREFIDRCGAELAGSIQADQPERYAHDYRMLIEAYVQGLRRTSSMFRSL